MDQLIGRTGAPATWNRALRLHFKRLWLKHRTLDAMRLGLKMPRRHVNMALEYFGLPKETRKRVPDRDGPWSYMVLEQLLGLHAERLPLSEMALDMEMPAGMISEKLVDLGLPEHPEPKRLKAVHRPLELPVAVAPVPRVTRKRKTPRTRAVPPTASPPSPEDRLREMHRKGIEIEEIAKVFRVRRETIYRRLKKLDLEFPLKWRHAAEIDMEVVQPPRSREPDKIWKRSGRQVKVTVKGFETKEESPLVSKKDPAPDPRPRALSPVEMARLHALRREGRGFREIGTMMAIAPSDLRLHAQEIGLPILFPPGTAWTADQDEILRSRVEVGEVDAAIAKRLDRHPSDVAERRKVLKARPKRF
jgi:hypothetical protein